MADEERVKPILLVVTFFTMSPCHFFLFELHLKKGTIKTGENHGGTGFVGHNGQGRWQ